MDWFSSPALDASVMAAWERLMQGDKSPTGALRGVVDDSWHRCLDGRVDPWLERRRQFSLPCARKQ